MGSSIYGMPVDDVLDVLKKIGISSKELELVGVICCKLKEGEICLKDVNKMSEERNFKLLKREWNYRHESSDSVLALRKFQLNTEHFSRLREERSLSLITRIGRNCGIDIVVLIEGSIQARRADFLSDVDVFSIVGSSEDVPKLKLLMMLAAYCSGEVICPSILTGEGIRSRDELYTAATYDDTTLLSFHWLDPPCGATSDDFLEEIRGTIRSGVKKFYTYSSLYSKVLSSVRNYGELYRRRLLDEIDIQFRKFLKLLDLGLRYTWLKREELTYAGVHQTFWERIQTVPSTTKEYKELELDLGSMLIDVGGDPRGYLSHDKNVRRTINRIIGMYCIF